MSVSQQITSLHTTKKSQIKGKDHFFQEMKQEMKKVSWTTKEELLVCTKIVVSAIFALGMGIYAVDLFIRFVLHCLSNFFCFVS